MEILSNLPLRYKVMTPGVIGVISFAVYLVVNFSASEINAEMLLKVQQAHLPILELANKNVSDLDKIKQDLIFAATSGEQSMLDESNKVSGDMEHNIQELSTLDPDNKGKVDAIGHALSEYIGTVIPLTKAMISGTADMSQAQPAMKKMKERLTDLEGLLAQYSVASRSGFVGAVQDVNQRSKYIIDIGLAMGVATMGLLLGMAWWMSGMISSDVKAVGASLKQIASGEADLTRQLQSRCRDEIGELVQWFNIFVQRLRTIIAEVSSSTAQLAAASEQMMAVVDQAKSGAGLQQRETEQLAAAIREMTMTIEGMARNASKAAEAAETANKESANGQGVVIGAIATIDALVGEVEKTAGAINKLEQESQNIGKVLDVIRDIADQTNLLALNAAIEAARAGDQGRGFAVVADEVRRLAQRSSQSTSEIREIIERLQSGAHDAVQVMQIGRSKAQESVKQAAGAGAALEIITSNVSGISTMNMEIAVTAEQQSSVAEEVNKNIININNIALDTAQGASQATESSTELTKLAVRLQQMVGQFKI